MVHIKVDLSHLDKFGPKMPQIRRKGLDYVANDLVRILDVNSPVDEGVLHKWFIAEKSDSVYKIRSPAKYTPYVNDGHSQQVGRFIPGVWNGDKFNYNPKAKTGMVLKQPYVKGQKFVEKSIRQIEPKIEPHFLRAIEDVL